MYKLILFDIGRVLVELTGADLIHRFAHTELDDEHIHNTWITIPGVQRFETGLCDEKEFARDVIQFYNLSCPVDVFANHFQTAAERKFDGVDAFLSELGARHDLACLTNTNPMQWPRISEEFGLGQYFPKQYVSYELGLMKPNRAIYEHVVEDTNLDASEILFIDDNLANCTTAGVVGMDTCHVSGFDDAEMQVRSKLS